MPTVLLPGELLPLPSSSSTVTLGPGTLQSTSRDGSRNDFVATKMGVLSEGTAGKRKKGGVKGVGVMIDSRSKRYIPVVGDMVVGSVIARHAEGFRVDIGSSTMASLDKLAFEGATKRSAPKLEVGTLVYARVSIASRDMEPELECVSAVTGKAEGFGELKEGAVMTCSLQLCRSLLAPKSPINLLSPLLPFAFELAPGHNGRIWVKATGNPRRAIGLMRVLEAVDEGEVGWEAEEVGEWCKQQGIVLE